MSFPAEFLWGAATSAYQIEGATREDGRGPSIWDAFTTEPGRMHQGESGEIAVDHYHRMEQDVRLMAELGLTAYRFSIAWPRVLPEGAGSPTRPASTSTSRLVDDAARVGHHARRHALPLGPAAGARGDGGWRDRDTAQAFADYAEVVAQRLGDRVRWWVTHNEPWCTRVSRLRQRRACAGRRGDHQAAVDVAHHLLLSPRPRDPAHPRARADGAGRHRAQSLPHLRR